MRNCEPYVYNPVTESSGTEKFVYAFLNDYTSLYEHMHGSAEAQEPLYTSGNKDFKKRYIGRAARLGSGYNQYEELWCARIDIGDACRTLTTEQRIILGRWVFLFENEAQIAQFLREPISRVAALKNSAIKRIAAILDGEV